MIRVFSFIFALFAMLAPAAENLGSWQKQMPIKFSGYTPPGNETLTNFPALVILSNTVAGVGFNYNDFLSPPYGDLRFAAADKTTPLNFEVETWDTNGNSYVWVQVPILAGTNTQIWAFWGRSGVSAPACTTNGDVWADGYIGVWHMGATNGAGQVPDSVATPHHGTNFSTTLTTGQIGSARALNDSSSIEITGITNPAGSITIEYWLLTTTIKNSYITDSELGRLVTAINQTTVGKVTYYEGAWRIAAGTDLNNGLWHHVVFSLKSANGTIYVDGNMSATGIPYSNKAIGGRVQIGAYNSGTGNNFNGLLDEVRISTLARPANWVWACWMSMASNSAFNTYDPPAFGGVPDIVNSNAVVTIPSTTLNGYLASAGLDTNVSAAVFWGTNDPGPTRDGWENTNLFSGWTAEGPLSTNVVPTASGAKYYYRFFASNSIGSAWASPANTFVSPGPPTVNNALGAINLTLTSATLQGEVTGGKHKSRANSDCWRT